MKSSTVKHGDGRATSPQATTILHPAFERLRSEEIPSLNLVMEEFRHRETGAIHFHLACDNPENVFLVAFRTVPSDSTGVAHILEHTALCGSLKFPVRDPFFMMIRRSLNTFMNAFTSSDWTAYPFASKNHKDYFNLLSVYLDAAFFSRLDELDFAQEGHRLEFQDQDDPSTPLQYKGVVYNEMKGAMSSVNSHLWQTITRFLFPTLTYHHNSGGDPAHIPDLSYAQLKSFYETHYHPSNAVFMTFGDLPVNEIQEQMETLALARFKKLDVDVRVGDEKRYLAPIRVEDYYSSDEESENKTHIVVAWLLGKSINIKELLKSQLLSSVLLDNSASPLMQILETSELGSAPSPMCGLEDSQREMSFLCGLEGCAGDATMKVESLVLDTLAEIARQGVPEEQVEAALHQLELQQREITGDGYPYGLQLMLMGLPSAIHRGDPIKLLNFDSVLEELREEIRDPGFIPGLIRLLLLDNPHRVTLTLRPEPELATRREAAEREHLDGVRDRLSDSDIRQIIARSQALVARQEAEDDPEILPKVGLEDIPDQIDMPAETLLHLAQSGRPVHFYGQGTNGLAYQQLVVDLPQLEDRLLEALPLYTSCLTELGVGELDYTQVQTWQSRITGGVNCYSSLRSLIGNEQECSGVMVLSAKSLQANHGAMTELLARTFDSPRFDESRRVRELIEQICARKESSITGQGHSLAMSLASSRMSPAAQLSHRFAGLEGIKSLKLLRDRLRSPDAVGELLARFRELHEMVRKAPRRYLAIAEPDHRDTVLAELAAAWDVDATSPGQFAPLTLPPIRSSIHQAWTTSTQVNFCAKAYPTVPSGHPDNPVLCVLAGFLRNGYLHRAIREQGGAYGGGADQDGDSASFRFYSYRDPRLAGTLQDFDDAIAWLLGNQHKPRQLEEAVLGVIGSMDKPSSPAGEARRAFFNTLFGRDHQHLLEFRRRVLEVSLDDLRRVAATWLRPESASIGVITTHARLQDADFDHLEEITL